MAKPMEEIRWQELELGAVVTEPGNSIDYKTGSWRSDRPVVKKTQCLRCGLCWLYCPEMCIQKTKDGFFMANLDYCKGCGICAKECPAGCIEMQPEEV